MKTWMKVLIIIILMTCASGATCFVFYKNLENNNKPDLAITNYLKSSHKSMFDEELELAVTNCNDERIYLLHNTLNAFDEILEDTNYYYVNFSKNFVNKYEVKQSFANLINKKTQLHSILIEYNIKCANSNSFDKNIGLNDIFISFVNFFKDYADFIQFMNIRVCDAIKSDPVDIKFSVIELYSLVVKDSFSIIIDNAGLKNITSKTNITYMNNLIDFENGQLKTNSSYYSSNSSNFIANFNMCDKAKFAKNLCTNLDSVSGSLTDMTTDELTAYYLKEIFRF